MGGNIFFPIVYLLMFLWTQPTNGRNEQEEDCSPGPQHILLVMYMVGGLDQNNDKKCCGKLAYYNPSIEAR